MSKINIIFIIKNSPIDFDPFDNNRRNSLNQEKKGRPHSVENKSK
jgi:hypothetical protein